MGDDFSSMLHLYIVDIWEGTMVKISVFHSPCLGTGEC